MTESKYHVKIKTVKENEGLTLKTPGKTISEEIAKRGWTQADLAAILGVSNTKVNKIIREEELISVELDLKLSRVIGTEKGSLAKSSIDQWLEKHGDSSGGQNNIKALIYQYFPINALVKQGRIGKKNNLEELESFVKGLLEIKTITEKSLDDKLSTDEMPAFRKSSAFAKYNHINAKIWFLLAKQIVSSLNADNYRIEMLQLLIRRVKTYTVDEQGVSKFLNDLTKCGVSFIVLPHLPQTYIDGASFWHDNRPVIVYTERLDRIDNFWFVICHEIGHILLHRQNINNVFINVEFGKGCWSEKEEQADTFALEVLNAERITSYFKGNRYVTKNSIIDAEKHLQIGKGVMVGILQKNGIVPWRNLNEFKYKVSDLIPEEFRN